MHPARLRQSFIAVAVVWLACAGLHFNVEIHHTVAGGKSGARHDLVSDPHFADIGEKLLRCQFHVGIAVARFLVKQLQGHAFGMLNSHIAAVMFRIPHRLTPENIHRIFDSLRLILLYLKLKLHDVKLSGKQICASCRLSLCVADSRS